MRRALATTAVLGGASILSRDVAAAGTQQAAAALQLVRGMAGGAPAAPAEDNVLTRLMPPIAALPRQAVTTALSLTTKLVSGAATSGVAKGAVVSFADFLMKEQVVKLSALDLSFWSYWLGLAGYNKEAGLKQLATAATPKVAAMEPQQVANLVAGFHKAGHYDKALFGAVSDHVSAHFTKYETEQLLPMLGAFSDFSHYNATLFDDIGDSIAYANHYLAPVKAPTDQVCKALGAFAKFGHERADTLLILARGISELGLSKLSPEVRTQSVVNALKALKRFRFYPEQVDALLYFTQTEAHLYSHDDLMVANDVKKEVEEQTRGKLAVYQPNDAEDAAHWYAHHAHHAPSRYELYVFRDALVPGAYTPAGMRAAQQNNA